MSGFKNFPSAISPQQAAKLNDEKECQSVCKLVDEINSKIKATYLTGNKVTINIPSTTDRIKRKVKEIFAQGGWDVKEDYGDQRDPYCHWVFTAKTTSSRSTWER